MMPKICKIHGELKEEDTRRFLYKSYQCLQCMICNREYDRKRRLSEKRKEYERNRKNRPDYKEKIKQYAENYKKRRRVVSREYYLSHKNDTEFKRKNNEQSRVQYVRNKEAFSDSYIKKILKVYKNATPEMIESKKQQILEFRRLRKEIKLNKELLINRREELRKDREERGIIKVCKIHGELKIEQILSVRNGKKSKNKIVICTQCKNGRSKVNYEKNKDYLRGKNKLYRDKNIESIRKRIRSWHINLSDGYVITRLSRHTNIKREHITQELIDLKRSVIMIKRKIKELK
jgi:hypothetical protein